MDKDRLIEEAKIYVENDKTIEETAKDLGISKRTLQLHLKKIKEFDKELDKLVISKKKKNIIMGNIKGGKIGKATPSYTKEEVNSIAREIISKHFTYEEASIHFGIPKSTIFEMMHSKYMDPSLSIKLEMVSLSNRKGTTENKGIKR